MSTLAPDPVELVREQLARKLDIADLYADLGLSPHSEDFKALVAREIAPLAGAAQGLNPAVFMNNVPAPGSYVIDQQRFDLLTERNDMPVGSDAWPGFANRLERRIANVGVLANIRLRLNLSLVVAGTGTVTSLYKWPWGLIRRGTVNANGGSEIIQAEGGDLRARRSRLFRNPREQVISSPAVNSFGEPTPGVIANGTYPVVLILDFPIVHDPASLTGALFAQSDQNYLNWILETAAITELLTVGAGSTATLTGTVDSELTFYSIPSMDAQNGRVVVLPQAVRWLHEFIANENAFSNTGEVPTPFVRNNGQLVCAYVRVDNGDAAQVSPASWDGVKWAYAGNQIPRDYTQRMYALLEENQRDYNGLIAPGYVLLDFEKENVARDIVYPRGLAELAVKVLIPTSVTLATNSKVRYVLETLTQG